MAMSAPPDPGNGLPAEQHEINVTPFIDVMLVLLIIFMVAAPLATVNVPVDLPSANGIPDDSRDEPVILSLTADGELLLGEEPVVEGSLQQRLQAATDGDTGQRLHLRADQGVSYGEVMGVMNRLREAGFLKVALIGLDGGAR